MLDFEVFVSVFVTLLVIMDPPGALPIFLALTKSLTQKQRVSAARRASLVAFGVIAAFAVFGQQILGYLHISLPALQGAGGLLLLLVALELLTGKGDEPTETQNVNVALVPLGTPLLAGPGAIVATIVFVKGVDDVGAALAVALGIVAVHVVLWLFMRFSVVIMRVIKDSGVTLVTRIAGLLLSAIAVQLVADGVTTMVKNA